METLYEPSRQPLDLLQTISVSNKVRRAGLHGVLKIGPNQRVIKDTDSSANGRRIINIRLSLEATSLQWMEGEQELSMRTFVTCMELPRFPVAKDD